MKYSLQNWSFTFFTSYKVPSYLVCKRSAACMLSTRSQGVVHCNCGWPGQHAVVLIHMIRPALMCLDVVRKFVDMFVDRFFR